MFGARELKEAIDGELKKDHGFLRKFRKKEVENRNAFLLTAAVAPHYLQSKQEKITNKAGFWSRNRN